MTAIITALTTVEGALWGLIALLTWVFREGFFSRRPHRTWSQTTPDWQSA